ncbi:hypothetical protein HPB50_020978 [Hyalomma asiaticum]|uniref:Uncharacterized protein n=1 Tax=Hyalomma asiaticum TaxID=266040 RepID=A0ACB7T6J5_HYAAI|nr:hypothetical protein HPB50_020978 [Hyalomma asiaticum]
MICSIMSVYFDPHCGSLEYILSETTENIPKRRIGAGQASFFPCVTGETTAAFQDAAQIQIGAAPRKKSPRTMPPLRREQADPAAGRRLETTGKERALA